MPSPLNFNPISADGLNLLFPAIHFCIVLLALTLLGQCDTSRNPPPVSPLVVLVTAVANAVALVLSLIPPKNRL